MIIPGLAIPFFLAPVEYLALPALLPRPPILQWAGAGLVMISWILFGEARRRIRASYSGHLGVSASQKLVQSGPYALVRHPAYLSFLLMAAGFSLGYSSLIGLLAIPILLAPGLAYRIRVEESLLEAHFEEEWRGYASRTRRLIPWVW
jgi:protein-S-isoprenylcysteine O-methyltransferase Ste14